LPWSGAPRRRGRASTLRSETRNEDISIGVGPADSQSSTQSNSRPERRRPKVAPRLSQSESKRPETRNRGLRRAQPKPRTVPKTRSEPKRRSSTRSDSQRSSNRSRSSDSRKSRSQSSRSNNVSKRGGRFSGLLDFFPGDTYGSGRQVVTSRSVDCAREDKLRVFVPNERLDAARFDGLTLIALDARGDETAIYIPANYIEGFRLASSGRIRPQGYQRGYHSTAPNVVSPHYGSRVPDTVIEAAPCPSGTSKQPDGTCLQQAQTGYPTR